MMMVAEMKATLNEVRKYLGQVGGAHLKPDLTLTPTRNPKQVRQEVRVSNVTLGSIAMNEVARTLTSTRTSDLTLTITLT